MSDTDEEQQEGQKAPVVEAGAAGATGEQVAPTKDKPKKGSKGLVAALVVVAVLAVCGIAYWYVNVQVPHQQAVDALNAANADLDSRNSTLDAAISDLQAVQTSGEKPLDPSTDEAATAAITQAQAARQSAPDMPDSTDDINAATEQIKAMGDYADQLDAIASAKQALQDSIAQMRQVTNPEEAFVIQRLTGLPNITGVQAATEDNDPNEQLHKAGGYTSDVYFSSDLVDSSKTYADPEYAGAIIQVGTDGGGSVEVFANEDDAYKREAYLAVFDGTALTSGYHEVVGTCVIRLSQYLTATQQEDLAQEITDSLTRLE